MNKTSRPYHFSSRTIVKLALAVSFLSISLSSFAKTQDALTQSSSAQVKNTTKINERVFSLPKVMHEELMKNMILVEAGSFTMGSDSSLARKREQPAHQVSLDSFYISRYELTQDIFEQIMGWNNSYFACDKCAVNNISWFNTVSYTHLTLPTNREV